MPSSLHAFHPTPSSTKSSSFDSRPKVKLICMKLKFLFSLASPMFLAQFLLPFRKDFPFPQTLNTFQLLQVRGPLRKINAIHTNCIDFSSVQFSCSIVSDSLRPHESQHAWPPCPSPSPRVQTHVHRVGDAIQPSHPLSSPSPPAPNPSQHQSLFQ